MWKAIEFTEYTADCVPYIPNEDHTKSFGEKIRIAARFAKSPWEIEIPFPNIRRPT